MFQPMKYRQMDFVMPCFLFSTISWKKKKSLLNKLPFFSHGTFRYWGGRRVLNVDKKYIMHASALCHAAFSSYPVLQLTSGQTEEEHSAKCRVIMSITVNIKQEFQPQQIKQNSRGAREGEVNRKVFPEEKLGCEGFVTVSEKSRNWLNWVIGSKNTKKTGNVCDVVHINLF